MARTTPPPSIAGDPPVVSDAISLLRRDHGIVELLFAEFERTDPAQSDPIARRICKMLTVHAQIEEELFYPAARLALRQDESIDAALAEHAEAKRLVAEIEAMTSDHSRFQPAMQELAIAVKQHVAEEEQEIFARLANTRLDLEALGIALIGRKITLMEVMGLHYDDELPARPEIQDFAVRSPSHLR
jgi:hemerythrin superfamily protein